MKIFTTILIIIIIVAVGFGAYWYFNSEETESGIFSDVNIGDFFPFGQAPEEEFVDNNQTPQIPENTDNTPETTGPLVLPKLFEISEKEQAGATIFASSTETLVRYADRQTGNIYEFNLTVPEVGRKRITNRTIPKIHSTIWFEKGQSLLLQYIDSRTNATQTTYGNIVSGTASSTDGVVYDELQTSFVGDSIYPVTNPALNQIAYIQNVIGKNSLTVSNKNGSNSKEVTDLGTGEWNVAWPAANTIVLTTKPSEEIPGYSYAINTTNGSLRKIIGDLNGLTVLPHSDTNKFLISETISGFPQVSVYTRSTNKKEPTPFKTLSEKCAWTSGNIAYCAVPKALPSGNYPDSWYMGDITFEDSLWSYDVSSGLVKQIFDPANLAGQEMDIVEIVVDPDGKYLLFTNKKDSSLWVYTL